MDFYRYHGLGNDYLVIDPRESSTPVTAGTVRLICDRHFGAGSDGVLYGPLFDHGGIPRVRIFNPDGGEAEKSGNGTRIFARYLTDAGDRPLGERFPIQTLGGTVHALVADPRGPIAMEMGRVSFQSEDIPMTGPPREVVGELLEGLGRPLRVTAVNIGNPHCVVPVPRATETLAVELGPRLEHHPAFPERTNVQFLELVDQSTIRIEIWERGAGYTLASGTSAAAAASAAVRLGHTNRHLTVLMPGGRLAVHVGKDWLVTVTGPVAAVSSGYWAPDFRDQLLALGQESTETPAPRHRSEGGNHEGSAPRHTSDSR